MIGARLTLYFAALQLIYPANGQDDCQIFYLLQPPGSLSCNPYLDSSRYSLRVECMIAIDLRISSSGEAQLDDNMEISWFAQLGGDSSKPEELILNNTSTFGARIDFQPESLGDFRIYRSQARITMPELTFDKFWCKIKLSETLQNNTGITGFERSEITTITDSESYRSPLLPFCPDNTFFHQTALKCAIVSQTVLDNVTVAEPPSEVEPSDTTNPSVLTDPTSCPPPVFRERSDETSRLVSVLLPSLMLPVIVAVLLVVAAFVMTCGRGGWFNKKQKGRGKRAVNEAASMENLTSPVITSQAESPITQPDHLESAPRETVRAKTPPPRPPPPAMKPPIKNTNLPSNPLPTIPITAPSSTVHQPVNRFSQDIYEDIADSALESYSMSNNDIYRMQGKNTREDQQRVMDRLPQQSGPFLSQKVGRRDDSLIGHYKNAALISISDRMAPMLVSKKTAASLPSLLDPKHYRDNQTPKRRANEAPETLRGTRQQEQGDHYDNLATKNKTDHTYTNQSIENASSRARLIEDDEPDYDEVDEEEERVDARLRGGSGGGGGGEGGAARSKGSGKLAPPARQQNCISVMSESYEDMSGMEDFIESYKSVTSSVTAL